MGGGLMFNSYTVWHIVTCPDPPSRKVGYKSNNRINKLTCIGSTEIHCSTEKALKKMWNGSLGPGREIWEWKICSAFSLQLLLLLLLLFVFLAAVYFSRAWGSFRLEEKPAKMNWEIQQLCPPFPIFSDSSSSEGWGQAKCAGVSFLANVPCMISIGISIYRRKWKDASFIMEGLRDWGVFSLEKRITKDDRVKIYEIAWGVKNVDRAFLSSAIMLEFSVTQCSWCKEIQDWQKSDFCSDNNYRFKWLLKVFGQIHGALGLSVGICHWVVPT